MGVTGDKPEGVAGGGLMGDRFVGEATVRDDRLRDNATVLELAFEFVGGRSG